MKRVALTLLWLALIAEIAWIVLRIRHGGSFLYPLFVSLAFGAHAVTRGRTRWLAAALRMFIGFAFVSAVLDRFGLWGGPGSPGVSWGNFPTFVRYTAQVNAFLPWTVIPALAVIETILEGSLGVAMLIGWRARQAIPASALLLAAFSAAMTISLGFSSQFPYAVPVMAAGAWLLATTDASAFGVDQAMARHRCSGVRLEGPKDGPVSIRAGLDRRDVER